MNTHSFKFFALFSLVAFSSARSYSIDKVIQSQFSATDSATPKSQETAQVATTPEKSTEQTTEMDVYVKDRMNKKDMDELKKYIRLQSMDGFTVWAACFFAHLMCRR